MGNNVIQKTTFNIINESELKEFLSSINVIDGFFADTSLSISSKCLEIINNLINHLSHSTGDPDEDYELYNYQRCDISNGVSIPFDKESFLKVNKLKSNCQLIRHLSIFNSNINKIEEYIELNNFSNLVSLQLENLQIEFVKHLKLHRATLLKLCVHNCIPKLGSLIELCGGDESFSGSWSELLHLDVRYNRLKSIDNSVSLLSQLTVLDVSRNDLESISFVEKIPTLVCLNASYNFIKTLPKIANHCLKVLIIGYNYLEGLANIVHFQLLSTLNASYNVISTYKYMSDLNELNFLKNLILRGNPICSSSNYRFELLKTVSSHVMSDFELDGRIISNKERTLLQKSKIIVIDMPNRNVSSTFHSQVDIIIPEVKTVKQLNSYKNSPAIGKPEDIDIIPTDIEPPMLEKVNKVERTENFFPSNDTDGADELPTLQPSVDKPCYHGKNTSILTCISEKSRESFFQVSLQVFEHIFMAVDVKCATVDKLDLCNLLYAKYEEISDKVLKLIFFKDIIKEENYIMKVTIRLLEFSDSSEPHIFMEQLEFYLRDFTISYDENINSVNTLISMKCKNCLSCYQFNSDVSRPFTCSVCRKSEFMFVNVAPRVPISENAENIVNPRNLFANINDQNTFNVSPNNKKRIQKNLTSDIVIKAISSEHLSKASDDESATSNTGTSYHTPIGRRSSHFGSNASLFNISSNSNLETLVIQKKQDYTLDNLNLAITVEPEDISKSQIINSNSPSYTAEMKYLTSYIKSDWVIFEPLSHIHIHMSNASEIDDRVKLHFLTYVMEDREDLKAVIKANIIFKTTESTEALVVLSNDKIRFYNWTDKDSPSFEDCLKLIVEFKFTSLLKVIDCLNHQWLHLEFKKKQNVSLFIGDRNALKNFFQILADGITSNGSDVKILQKRYIGEFDSSQIITDMAKAMNEDPNTIVDESFEYFLIKSCSHIQNDTNNNEYVPKLIVLHSEHIFFIGVKIKSKTQKVNFELYSTLSLHTLKNKIDVNRTNSNCCQLKIFEDHTEKVLDVEFLSPTSRSQALLHLNKLWIELYQTSIEFQIVSFEI